MAPTINSSSSGSKSSPDSLSCVTCRSRKLKCDRVRPVCTRCQRADGGTQCVYPESKRRPTFKRRNVRDLEDRLAQVEHYLKDASKGNDREGTPAAPTTAPEAEAAPAAAPELVSDQQEPIISLDMPDFSSDNIGDTLLNDAQLISLGISESLPPPHIMVELSNMYLDSQHNFVHIINPSRFWQSFYGPPSNRPPMMLLYSMWSIATHVNNKYSQLNEEFYRRARQYADMDEARNSGAAVLDIPHAQAYVILATYEAKRTLFTNSAMTGAKGIRVIQMMGLDRMDEGDDGADQSDVVYLPNGLAPAATWIELEERRRVFWSAYTIDTHASVATGWPSLIDTNYISTRLPCSDEAYFSGQKDPYPAPFLDEVFSGAALEYSAFAAIVVICRLFKAVAYNIYRCRPAADRPDDMVNGRFWAQHRELDNGITSTFLFLPDKMRVPQNMRDPAAITMNLNLHAASICLHHGALDKLDRHVAPSEQREAMRKKLMGRLEATAEEVVHLAKMTAHNTTPFKTVFSAIALYAAASVYIYLIKKRKPMPSPNPSAAKMPSHPAQTDRANLQIIISTLESLSRTQGVLRKFLIQACMDVERNGLSSTIRVPHRIVQHFSVTPTEKEHIMSKACFQPLISAISRNIGSPQIGEGPYPLEKEGRNVGESVQRSDVAIRPSAALPISASASASEEASPLNTNVFSETRPPSSCGNTSPGTFTGSHGGGDGSAPSFLDQLSDSVMENALRGDWGVVMQGNGLDWDPAAA